MSLEVEITHDERGASTISHKVGVGGYVFKVVDDRGHVRFYVDDENVEEVMFEATLHMLHARAACITAGEAERINCNGAGRTTS